MRTTVDARIDYAENRSMSGHTTGLFTLGYQGLCIEEFIQKLKKNSIDVLIDVRRNPISRKPGFSKKSFSETLERQEIEYYHLPDLGIPSSERKNLDAKRPSTYDELFSLYEYEILPKAAASVAFVVDIAEEKRVALTCFEADHRFCHRTILSRNIVAQSPSTSVTHL